MTSEFNEFKEDAMDFTEEKVSEAKEYFEDDGNKKKAIIAGALGAGVLALLIKRKNKRDLKKALDNAYAEGFFNGGVAKTEEILKNVISDKLNISNF